MRDRVLPNQGVLEHPCREWWCAFLPGGDAAYPKLAHYLLHSVKRQMRQEDVDEPCAEAPVRFQPAAPGIALCVCPPIQARAPLPGIVSRPAHLEQPCHHGYRVSAFLAKHEDVSLLYAWFLAKKALAFLGIRSPFRARGCASWPPLARPTQPRLGQTRQVRPCAS